jgi:hypothetical protein
MDESKSKTKVNRGECAVIHYIFCVMYEKRVLCNQRKSWRVGCNSIHFSCNVCKKEPDVMDNENVSGSSYLIL